MAVAIREVVSESSVSPQRGELFFFPQSKSDWLLTHQGALLRDWLLLKRQEFLRIQPNLETLEARFPYYSHEQKMLSGRLLAGPQNRANPIWENVYSAAERNFDFRLTVFGRINHDADWVEAEDSELSLAARVHFYRQGYMYGLECPWPKPANWSETTQWLPQYPSSVPLAVAS